MKRTPVGIDIAKAVFQLHYMDAETGEIVNKPLKRAGFLVHFANRAPCVIGMQACSGAQHWARELVKLGIRCGWCRRASSRRSTSATRATRPMRGRSGWPFSSRAVAVKTEAQQAVLALHRMREQLVKSRTMQSNSLRGLLAEYGEVMGAGRAALDRVIPAAASVDAGCEACMKEPRCVGNQLFTG